MHFLRCSHFWTEHFQPGEWYHSNISGNQSGASQPVTAVRHCRRRYHRYPCHRSCLRMYDPVQVFCGTSRIRTGEFARENEAQGVRYGEVADWGRRKRLWMTFITGLRLPYTICIAHIHVGRFFPWLDMPSVRDRALKWCFLKMFFNIQKESMKQKVQRVFSIVGQAITESDLRDWLFDSFMYSISLKTDNNQEHNSVRFWHKVRMCLESLEKETTAASIERLVIL